VHKNARNAFVDVIEEVDKEVRSDQPQPSSSSNQEPIISQPRISKPSQPKISDTLVDKENDIDDLNKMFNKLTIPERIERAEILLCLAQAETNISFRAADTVTDVISMIDPNHFSSKICLGKTKVEYLIKEGISKYAKLQLIEDVGRAKAVSLYLDTATFHQVSESNMTGSLVKNLNFIVKFFNERSQRVEVHFLEVVFLAQETAEIQLEVIKNVLNEFDIDIRKVVQIGRDDPNVNKKLMRIFKAEQVKVTGKMYLYDTGACTNSSP
jgi:hypothetical protein